MFQNKYLGREFFLRDMLALPFLPLSPPRGQKKSPFSLEPALRLGVTIQKKGFQGMLNTLSEKSKKNSAGGESTTTPPPDRGHVP